MLPGFRSFQRIEAGEILATDGKGEVRSPETGLLLLPLYQPQGEDGFFLVREPRT
jgi:succinylglutamate desuccinylase